jgi:hypothetical protein
MPCPWCAACVRGLQRHGEQPKKTRRNGAHGTARRVRGDDQEAAPLRRGKMDATFVGSALARPDACCSLRFSRRMRANVFRRSVFALDVYRNVGSRIDFMGPPSAPDSMNPHARAHARMTDT